MKMNNIFVHQNIVKTFHLQNFLVNEKCTAARKKKEAPPV